MILLHQEQSFLPFVEARYVYSSANWLTSNAFLPFCVSVKVPCVCKLVILLSTKVIDLSSHLCEHCKQEICVHTTVGEWRPWLCRSGRTSSGGYRDPLRHENGPKGASLSSHLLHLWMSWSEKEFVFPSSACVCELIREELVFLSSTSVCELIREELLHSFVDWSVGWLPKGGWLCLSWDLFWGKYSKYDIRHNLWVSAK